MEIPQELLFLASKIVEEGGRPMIVGGAVRDSLIGLPVKDYDVEVFGLDFDVLHAALVPHGTVSEVGKSFGILKFRTNSGMEFDFSIPRRENKIGIGHKDFAVSCDPNMSFRKAASRRDFTINSMMFDIVRNVVVDEFDGRRAILDQALRPTGSAFKEDALRILRGMQFASRFKMLAGHELIAMIGEMSTDEYFALPKERVWVEWQKWAASMCPEFGLKFLEETWIKVYPELFDMMGSEQDKVYHPEGDVWVHTKFVVQAMGMICDRELIKGEDREVLMFAALCHDMAKPITKGINEHGRICNHGHCELGVEFAERFLTSIGANLSVIERVKPLVAEHLAHVREDCNARIVRRLANRLYPAKISELCLLVEADMSGRPPLPGGPHPLAQKLLDVAKELDLQNNKPKPIVMGRHLIASGMQPGPEMGRLLKAAFEAQLEGNFGDLEGGLAFVKGM